MDLKSEPCMHIYHLYGPKPIHRLDEGIGILIDYHL